MTKMIFVNLPVANLPASRRFYEALGFTNNASEVMLAVSCDSREAVDAMNTAAAANGGTADINPMQDLGFMYNRNLADPDGHIWEAIWMNPAAMGAGEHNATGE